MMIRVAMVWNDDAVVAVDGDGDGNGGTYEVARVDGGCYV